MASCRDVAALVTPYVDGEVSAADRQVVDAHLRVCPPCRRRAEAEAAARHTVRTCLCRPCAPEQLRARCLTAARAGRFGLPRLTVASFSMAAAAALVAGGVLLYALTGLSPAVLAAQLTLDHMTCFAIHAAAAPIDPAAGQAAFAREHGWQIDLPEVSAAGLQLVGLRQCYCGEGATAHAMYRLNGRPVSLYMIPDVHRARASADVFGHDAIIWSEPDMTYVLLSREPRATLERLATEIRGASR